MRVGGLAPAAAAYAGISERSNVWLALMIGGGMAGLAGIFEVAGPIGVLQPVISPGYGFRCHHRGVRRSAASFRNRTGLACCSRRCTLGGESAQVELQLPASVSGLFQASLLFFMLAAELFIHFRLRIVNRRARIPPAEGTRVTLDHMDRHRGEYGGGRHAARLRGAR